MEHDWKAESDDFHKTYCSVCENKIYLNHFPKNWKELEHDEQVAYLNWLVDNNIGEAYAGLAGWNDPIGLIEIDEVTVVCRRHD